jgi:hypothetical protein
MTTEELIWILFILFLVLSNIASYKMGYVRGLMQGITTFELIEVRRKLAKALDKKTWEGNPESESEFEGLHSHDPMVYYPIQEE